MLPYATVQEAEEALGRGLTWSEAAWLRHTGDVRDIWLFTGVSVLVLMASYALPSLPLAVAERFRYEWIREYKLQPKAAPAALSDMLSCYKGVALFYVYFLGPVLYLAYPIMKLLKIRTGLPLPSAAEAAAQLVVYFLVEDYGTYWVHRALHSQWCYERIHHIHHEFTAPFGLATSYGHLADIFLSGLPSLVGPAIAPCHIATFWLWFALRQFSAVEIHTGYDFPFNPTNLIPFYGGAEYHDYHHFVGGQSKSNFATVFTYCDYIYGTNKGYRYHKAKLPKLKESKSRIREKVKGIHPHPTDVIGM